ncbi:MAG: hypothetical protein RBG13Loki_1224 [Promethearchaeota archaeon CR_4]|nr:MAG: hypothetical protein RBG13Loki_1224 [Candidatus Lokiarchaeota archaeon CR_4]
MHSNEILAFKPAASNGGKYSILFSLLVLGILSAVFILLIISTLDVAITIISILAITVFLCIFCTVIYGYYSMAYILSPECLILRWAFFKTVIPLATIVSIGTPSKNRFDGIRTAGVGIPNHLYGAFRLLLDGAFMPIKLFATKLTNLVILKTSTGNCYGITPENPEQFITNIKQKASRIVETTINNAPPLVTEQNTARKYVLLSRMFFIAVFVEMGIFFVFLFLTYPNLPDIVPLHYNISGLPDRFGNKDELLGVSLILPCIPITLNLLIFALTRRKSELYKSRYGPAIMLLPLLISTVFLVLNIAFIAPLIV